MIDIIVKTYLFFAISVMLHEMAHYGLAIVFKKKNIKVYIGNEFLRINIKNICISPIVFGGKVTFDSNNSKGDILIYSAGIFINIIELLLVNFLSLEYSTYYSICLMFSIIINVLPVLPGSDGRIILRYFINNTKKKEKLS